jgi:hypothetical protein
MREWLQWQICFSWLYRASILHRSGDRFRSATRKWLLIMGWRHMILPNTKSSRCTMWRMNTVPIIDKSRSINPNVYQATICSPQQWHQDLGNLLLIYVICAAMLNNTLHLTMWQKCDQNEAIGPHTHWSERGVILVHHLTHERIGGKLIHISIITTTIQWKFASYFGNRTSPTSGTNYRKCTQSQLICLMEHVTYSVS